MNPELYERYLAKKAKKLGISVEEAAKRLGSEAAKNEEDKKVGRLEGKPINESSLREFSQDQQTDKNPSTIQTFNYSTNMPPHPNPLPQGEGTSSTFNFNHTALANEKFLRLS